MSPSPTASDSFPAGATLAIAASVDFTDDAARSMTGTVTFELGGVIETTAADGTAFELSVPPHAVADDTLVTMTPLVYAAGLGAGPVHAVKLEPAGLELAELARLTITPTVPIALPEQLMFHATSDGDEVIAAYVDPAAEPVVVLVPHFSKLGVAKAAAHAPWLYVQSATAMKRLNHEIGRILQAERRQQRSGGEYRPEVWDEVIELFEEASDDVLGPLRDASLLDCDGASRYIDGLRGLEKAAYLMGLSADEFASAVQDEMRQALENSFRVCERAAKEECVAARDPGILYRFWVYWDRQLAMHGVEPEKVKPTSEDEARRICRRALQFEFSGEGTAKYHGQTFPIDWQYWGLLCPNGEQWRIWEIFDGVQQNSTTGRPGEDLYGPIIVTFDQNGKLVASQWPPIGDMLFDPRLYGTLQGTIELELSPGNNPEEVHVTIHEGDGAPIRLVEPVVPWTGAFGECPEE